MEFSEKVEKLIVFIVKRYERNDTFKRYSEYTTPIMNEFERDCGIRFGDAGAQYEAMDILWRRGLIDVNGISRGERVGPGMKVKPSVKGIEYVKEKQKSPLQRHWPKVLSSITEGVATSIIKTFRGSP